MRGFLTARWRRYALAFVVVGASFGIMGAQCQPSKPPPPPGPTGLSISPTEQDFGTDSADGQSSNFHFFTVTNHGPGTTGPLDSTTLGGTMGDASQFEATHPSAPGGPDGPCPGAVLAAGQSCNQQVFFNPTFAGSFRTTLVVLGNPGGTVTATLTGTGT
jgi:hypothetical protein